MAAEAVVVERGAWMKQGAVAPAPTAPFSGKCAVGVRALRYGAIQRGLASAPPLLGVLEEPTVPEQAGVKWRLRKGLIACTQRNCTLSRKRCTALSYQS